MSERGDFSVKARGILLLVSLCAFLAIFATVDTAEQYRAWSTARRWTMEQKVTATATDAERMHALSLVSLVVVTAVIAAAAAGGLVLGVSVATENARGLRVATALSLVTISCGFLYSAAMLAYRVLVGGRTVLKGPIFDYDMRMQPTILLAVAGFLVLSCLAPFILRRRRNRPSGF